MQRALNTFTSFKERILSGKKERKHKKEGQKDEDM
jgi:hypothetical protein